MSNNQVRAAVLVIGNEILSGRTQDKNVQFIAEHLSNSGILLKEVRIIEDIKSDIVDNVNNLRNNYDFVFTTGGIGPTHDDVTSESIASALSVDLELREEVAESIKQQYIARGVKFKKESLKMAMVPKGAELIQNNVSGAPGFRIDNVFVLPGVPNIMQSMFESVLNGIKTQHKFHSITLTLDVGESIIANICRDVQSQSDDVQIGSYPFVENDKWATRLVMRGQNLKKVQYITKQLKLMLKKQNIGFTED